MRTYAEDLAYLKSLIPQSEYDAILSQFGCELDDTFIGFISQYRAISEFLPKDMIIIDLGCYLAAQSYLFQQFPEYIGVDVVGKGYELSASFGKVDLKRFSAKNTFHYEMSIQDFLSDVVPKILTENKNEKVAVIMNYVPDFAVTEDVFKTFKNVYINYPGIPLRTSGIFKELN